MTDAADVRAKLEALRLLDPDEAKTIENLWPWTLEHLDGPGDTRSPHDRTPAWRLRELLEEEIDQALERAGGEGPAC